MNRKIQSLLVLIGLAATLLGAVSNAAPRGERISLEIEPPQERQWRHWGNKMGVDYFGTYDHTTWNRVFIRDPWGDLMEIPLFYCSPPDLSYILNKKAKFPEYVTDFKIDEGGRHKLIDLRVDELPLGEFEHWTNHGELAGGFHSMNVAPVVEMIKGRKGLKFQVSEITHIQPNYQALTSDFTVSDYLGKNKPFTMSAWVYDPKEHDVEYEGTVMSWHSIGGNHGTRLSFADSNCDVGGMSYTSRGLKGEGKGALGLHGSTEWQHVTYVYTGGMDGELRVYTNGRLVSTHRYDNITHRRPLKVDEIGTSSAIVRADLLAKSGKASVGLYYDVVDHYHWFQQRHWSWQNELKIAWASEGEVRFVLTDLKPGTKYYYRIQSIDMDDDWWSYQYNPMRRWCYGPGIFVTATEDGEPGYNVSEDTRKHFFIGANWGSFWYYGYAGPSGFLDAYVGDIQLYDYAMDELEVRVNAGLPDAFDPAPADDAELMELNYGFSWRQGSKDVAAFKVYRSTDKTAVEDGTAPAVIADKPALDATELDYGTRYFWRVAQLDANGRVVTDGDVWTFRIVNGEARLPDPANGDTINPVHELQWTPASDKGAINQHFYIAESLEALAEMDKPSSEVQPRRWGPQGSFKPGPDVLKHGRSYYWRIDTVREDGRVTPGEAWYFHVRDYVTPEPDSIIPEPLPPDYEPAVAGAKMMESSMGFPGLVSPGADNDPLLQVALGTRRFLEKSRLARDIVYQRNIGHVLSSYEGSGYANGFMTGSYGGFFMKDGKEVLENLLFHETGHQIHGVFNWSDPAFRMINRQVWLDHAEDNASLGAYDANNEFEQMAVNSQAYMHADKRYNMYRDNRSQYIALQPHMPGDLYIELDTDHGLEVDASGVVQEWKNKGGLLDWIDDAWRNMEGSSGRFTPVGSPRVETVRGVPAVTFSGNDALEWEFKTKYGLHENRDFAVEFWALKTSAGEPGQVLAGWGSDADGARFYWGSDGTAYRHGRDIAGNWGTMPQLGEWQHIVHVFRGGGKENGPGPYLIYVNGNRVHEGVHRFNLAEHARVFVGGVPVDGQVTGGFNGALAHVRIYNYDISDEQIADHYAEEARHFHKPYGHIAEKLYVGMDVRRLADVPRREHNPLYPAKMNRPWLRSWANHGTLAGRLHNDIHSYMWGPACSTPTPRKIDGIEAPFFSGKDRMFSGFMPDAEMLANAPGTLEVWIYSDAQSEDEVVLEWGDFQLDARFLKPGWQHVALIFTPTESAGQTPRRGGRKTAGKTMVFVNGIAAGEMEGVLWPENHQRLHVGGHYDSVRWNWGRYFNGAVAAIKVHKGRLTPSEIADNFRDHAFNQAHDPRPAHGDIVVAARKPSLDWVPGVVEGKAREMVYLGENPDRLELLGEFAPGELEPSLEPGRTYYWRVGSSEIWRFKTREGLLVDLNAADLEEGDLTKWENRGRHGGAFVPGSTPDTWTPESTTHLGVSSMKLMSGKALSASFDTPTELVSGPFTIHYRAARQIRYSGVPILSWGPTASGAVFTHASGDPFAWGERGQRGTFEHVVPRYPEGDERARELATLSAMARLWKSQCITYEDSTFRYYSDGRLVNEIKKEFSLPEPGRLVIGGHGDVTYFKELNVFSKALSAEEVAALDKGQQVASRDLLVSIVVPDQTDGERIPNLVNNGSLKGEFVAASSTVTDHVPSVELIDGVKCASFSGDAEFLESDNLMPEAFAGTNPFTVEARIFIRETKDRQGDVFFALAPQVAADEHGAVHIERHVDFSSNGIVSHARGNRVQNGKWQHVALVYDGGYRSQFRMYVNGERQDNATKTFTSLATPVGYPMYVGALFNTYSGVVRPFNGGIAGIKVYDYARTPEEIADAAKE